MNNFTYELGRVHRSELARQATSRRAAKLAARTPQPMTSRADRRLPLVSMRLKHA